MTFRLFIAGCGATGRLALTVVDVLAEFGAGRVVYQEFTRVSRAIKTGSFFNNHTLTDAVDLAVGNGLRPSRIWASAASGGGPRNTTLSYATSHGTSTRTTTEIRSRSAGRPC